MLLHIVSAVFIAFLTLLFISELKYQNNGHLETVCILNLCVTIGISVMAYLGRYPGGETFWYLEGNDGYGILVLAACPLIAFLGLINIRPKTSDAIKEKIDLALALILIASVASMAFSIHISERSIKAYQEEVRRSKWRTWEKTDIDTAYIAGPHPEDASHETGKEQNSSKSDSRKRNYTSPYENGYWDGYSAGKTDGYEDNSFGLSKYYRDSDSDYRRGYDEGYRRGYQATEGVIGEFDDSNDYDNEDDYFQ